MYTIKECHNPAELIETPETHEGQKVYQFEGDLVVLGREMYDYTLVRVIPFWWLDFPQYAEENL